MRWATLRSLGRIASISPELGEHDFRLRQIEVDGAAATPGGEQDLEELPHQLEFGYELAVLRDHRRIPFVDDRVDRRVGHARVSVDDAVVHLVAHHAATAIDLHQARLDEAIRRAD
jgi:hypothetical protein